MVVLGQPMHGVKHSLVGAELAHFHSFSVWNAWHVAVSCREQARLVNRRLILTGFLVVLFDGRIALVRAWNPLRLIIETHYLLEFFVTLTLSFQRADFLAFLASKHSLKC